MLPVPGSRWTVLWPLALLCLGLLALLQDSRPQQVLRNLQFDQFQRWHPRAYQPVPVRIVDIDEASLARLGQWPWPRTRLAELVDRLREAGASVVALDMVLAEPDRTAPAAMAALWPLLPAQRAQLLALPDHDAALARSLRQAPAVLGCVLLERGGSSAAPPAMAQVVSLGTDLLRDVAPAGAVLRSLPAFEQAVRGNGALNHGADWDGVVREVPLVQRLAGQPVFSLAAEALRVAQGERNVLLRGEAGGPLTELRIGAHTLPTSESGALRVYYSEPVPQRYVPAWQLLAGQGPAGELAGALVLVGSSAQGLRDVRFGPQGLLPGVEIQAQVLEQALAGQFLLRAGWMRALEALLMVLVAALAGWVALRARALASAAMSLGLLLALAGGAWWAFVAQGLLFDALSPAAAVLLAYGLCSLWAHRRRERQQRWIQQAFARYVSPNRVAHLVAHPQAMALGGRRQACSFVFTDLAGFTGMVESMEPAQAVGLLNVYLDRMVAIAFAHEGTLDRIVGDAVAIMFSAPLEQPDHARRALACALAMDAFALDYAAGLQARGQAFGQTRIGVHCGEVVVGNFGGNTVFDYRALGDPVNTAARLEGANRYLGTRVCVSGAIAEANPQAALRPVGELLLKGKQEAVPVFEPEQPGDGVARAPRDDYARAYGALDGDAAQAAALFGALAQEWPQDPLVRLHAGRLARGAVGVRIVLEGK